MLYWSIFMIVTCYAHLVGNYDFWFQFLGPPLEVEFRFCFQFQRFWLDFFEFRCWKNDKSNVRFQKLEFRKNVGTQYISFCNIEMVAAIPTSTQCRLLPYLHLLNACLAISTSTQRLSSHTYIYSTPVHIYSMPVLPYLHLLNACCNHLKKRRREHFPIHEIVGINGGRGFQTGRTVFWIGGNTFYARKNKILMKILEFKRSGIGIIAEFRGIPSGFPNQVCTSGING